MPLPQFVSRAHVLVVDDDATNRLVSRKLCQLFGATAEAAESGEQAIALCVSGAFDLVLMDIRMPLMDGVETSIAIRSLPGAAGRVPIIAVTGDTGPDLRALCYAAGMSTLVEKPIVVRTLFDAMEAALFSGGLPLRTAERSPAASG